MARTSPSPERRLALAILEQVRDDLRQPWRKKIFTETVSYIFPKIPPEPEEQAWPFSFDNLCGLLNIDAEWARERFRRIIRESATSN